MTDSPLDIDVQVGIRLRQIRKDRRMSLEALGRGIGVTYQQIQKYETGRNRIAASTLVALAGALDCAPTDLLPTPEATQAIPMRSADVRALAERINGLPTDRRRPLLSAIDLLISAIEPSIPAAA